VNPLHWTNKITVHRL